MMGRQIIKQPNGLYAVYSSNVDHFLIYDATPEDIIEDWVREAREDIERGVWSVVQDIERGGKPYHQFTRSFDEAVEWTRAVHKDTEDLDEIIRAANTPVNTAGEHTP